MISRWKRPYTDQAIGTRSAESLNELEKDNRIFTTANGKKRVKILDLKEEKVLRWMMFGQISPELDPMAK
jgi:hypothetical protein